jgi:hypothetical protein
MPTLDAESLAFSVGEAEARPSETGIWGISAMALSVRLLVAIFLSGLFVPAAGRAWAHSPLLCSSLGAFGAATTDGVRGPMEYKDCKGPITRKVGTKTYVLRICATNDADNAYFAVVVTDTTQNDRDSVWILFDNNHDGAVAGIGQTGCGPAGSPVEDFLADVGGIPLDGFYCSPGITPQFDNAQNITTARTFTPGIGWAYELSHPLFSGDPDDFGLKPLDRAGWCLVYDDESNPGALALGDFDYPPGCFAEAASGSATRYGNVRMFSSFLGNLPNFFGFACEVQVAKLPDLKRQAALAPLQRAEALLGGVTEAMTRTGEARLPEVAKHLLRASIFETQGFIRQVKEQGGDIDAQNERGTAASWIRQAEYTLGSMQKLLDQSP